MSVSRILAFAPKQPPREVQLWNPGANPTDFGTHHWTDRSAEMVMAQYTRRGNPLVIDIEHNGVNLPETGAPVVTGGYASLELRGGAPWLVFDWSAFAEEQIASGQRRFLSPEYDVASNGEIVGLVRVSLVADPATHNARMLATRAKTHARKQVPMTHAEAVAMLTRICPQSLPAFHVLAARSRMKTTTNEYEFRGKPKGDGGVALFTNGKQRVTGAADLDSVMAILRDYYAAGGLSDELVADLANAGVTFDGATDANDGSTNPIAASRRDPPGLQGAALDEFRRGMGIDPNGDRGAPFVDAHGSLVMPAIPPRRARASAGGRQ